MHKIFSKGFISILDQGIFAGTNFFLTIFLGKMLSPESYGIYSVAMVIFLLATGQYVSFILEPMSVLGPSDHRDNVPGYFRFLLKFHIGLSTTLSILIIFASYFLINIDNGAVRMMSLFLPFILTLWFVRWFFYMQGYPRKSLIISIGYSFLLITILLILNTSGNLSEGSAFVAIGLASIVPSLFVIITNLLKEVKIPVSFKSSLYSHWDYGKWIGLASLLNWASIQIYVLFVVALIGLEAAGGMKSIQNFAQPLEQISTALGLFLIPFASRLLVEKSRSQYRILIFSINGVLFAFGIVYLFVLWNFRDGIFELAYNGKYLEYAQFIPYAIMVPIIVSLSKGAQIGIRTTRQTKKLLIAYSLSALTTLIMGPILIQTFGFLGALIGMLFSAIIFSLLTNILFFFHAKGIMYGKEASEKISV